MEITRALCVLKPTRISPRWERVVTGHAVGELDDRDLSGLQKLLTWRSRQVYYNANPRHAQYMLQLARDFFKANAPAAKVDLLVGPATAARLPAETRDWAPNTLAAHTEDLSAWVRRELRHLRDQRYDTVIFLYPDAIGLGWSGAERALAHLDAKQTLVINGRRRVFAFDEQRQRALRWRRFLERSWAVEAALAAAIVPAAISLALWDGMSRLIGRGPRL